MKDFRAVALAVASEAVQRREVVAALLSGSIARGDAVPSSDVDLVFVTVPGVDLVGLRREVRDGVLVETVSHSEPEWRERFNRPNPRWIYAFLEAQVVHDDAGAADALIAEAADVRKRYRTPTSVLDELALGFWHGQAKLDRALASDDPCVRGYQASVAVDWIIDALFAAHDTPLPPASRRLDYLASVPLDREVDQNWSVLLTGDVETRLHAAAALIGWLRAILPEPDLTRI